MTYLYRCPQHGEFHSLVKRGAECPVCKRKGVRQFVSVPQFHPSKGA